MAKKLSLSSTVRLPTGYQMPLLGFGLFGPPPGETTNICALALQAGYRHFDTARYYNNESETGAALKAWIDSGKGTRADIFYTTKLHIADMGYQQAKTSLSDSLKRCGLGYIDLVLIHAPYGGREKRLGTWKALVEAVEAGQVRSIGVSNYGVQHLDELATYNRDELAKDPSRAGKDKAAATISVGQWEIHPWLRRPEIVAWCEKNGVVVEAYSPLTRGKKLDDATLGAVAKAHGKSPAQVLIRWSLDKGYSPLPKTVTAERMAENADVFDFELSAEDLARLDTDDYFVTAWDPTKAKLEK